MKKTVISLLVTGIFLLLGLHLYQRYTSKSENVKKKTESAIAIQAAPIQIMTIRDIRTFTGSLRAESMFIVAPKVGGLLEEITVNIGDAVHKNQLLARIESDEYRQQVVEAQAELEVARARIGQCVTHLNLAETEFKRVKELRQKKISSEAEYDQTESALKTVKAELMVLNAQAEQKQAALRAAEVRLRYTTIMALWDEGGSTVRYVGERFVDEGQMLMANTPILSIVDISSLNAVVNVIERDYPYLHVGQEAVITTDAYPGRTFAGTVQRISNILRESSRQAEVEIRVPNPDLRLKPGMFVRVRVEFARHENATVVPQAALVQYMDKNGVFLVTQHEKSDPQTVKFVAVQKGIEESGWVEVLSPAISGQVVILGHHLLRDGSQVILPAPSAKDGPPPPLSSPSGKE